MGEAHRGMVRVPGWQIGLSRLDSGRLPGSDGCVPEEEFGGFDPSSGSSEHIPAEPQ